MRQQRQQRKRKPRAAAEAENRNSDSSMRRAVPSLRLLQQACQGGACRCSQAADSSVAANLIWQIATDKTGTLSTQQLLIALHL